MIEEIKSLITEANGTNDINRLLEISMLISGHLIFFCGVEEGYLRDKYEAYNERKTFEATKILGSDSGITKAEREGVRDSKDHRRREMITEVQYMGAKNFRMQCNEYLASLRQKVAYLRKEHDNPQNQP